VRPPAGSGFFAVLSLTFRTVTWWIYSPYSVASSIDFVEFLARGSQESSHLFMQRLQASQVLVGRPLGWLEGERTDAFETREHPAQRWPISRLLELVGNQLAEHRLRQRLAATGQTIPSQLKQPTDRPTMRWVFQCFEGIDLLHIRHGPEPASALVLRLQPIHQQVLALIGPSYEEFYKSTN
jgi:hypothetical protein